MPEPKFQKPTIGRIVILRNQDGADIPAIITAVVDDAAVHVQQFVPPGVSPVVVSYEWGVDHSAEARAGTWRWPERT
jgi:hypothetical protein